MTETQWNKLRKHLLKETEEGKIYSVIGEILGAKFELPNDFLQNLTERIIADPEIAMRVRWDLEFKRKT